MSDESVSCSCEDKEEIPSKAKAIFKIGDFKLQVYSLILLIAALFFSIYSPINDPLWLSLPLLLLSYLLVGFEVLKKAFILLKRGDFFNEFTLMTIATFGAFYIGDYLEGVFVMLFYSTGEIIQGNATRSVRSSIKSLLKLNVKTVRKWSEGKTEIKNPEDILPGDHIQVNSGEMLALDGIVLAEDVYINTSNITGESLSRIFSKGDKLLAGMICEQQPFVYEASSNFDHSYISKIMHLVEEASSKKAKTQRLISRLAKTYTPIVFFMALALVMIPWFFDPEYAFDKWLYRGLVFLVISCPCAFLIAIPLSYFGGIGLAASKGILIKGGEVIEKLAKIKAFVFDKTGTLTIGKYSVYEIDILHDKELNLSRLYELELNSSHPLAKTIKNHLSSYSSIEKATLVKEYPGFGIEGLFENELFLAGNKKWLISRGISFKNHVDTLPTIYLAYANTYIGKITLTDQLKENAKEVIEDLRALNVDHLILLSGDNSELVKTIANELNLDLAFGDLLPEEKVSRFIEIREKYKNAAFVGDGINDAPVIAIADIGIAMGGSGSDAAIENADIIIEYDDLKELSRAIRIARKTQQNVYQNLFFAVFVKVSVLLLGALGIAGLWEAIFADVGVALLVVLNASRLKMAKI